MENRRAPAALRFAKLCPDVQKYTLPIGKRGRIEVSHIEAVQSPVPLPDYSEFSEISGREVVVHLMREQGITGPQPLESLRIPDLTSDEELDFRTAIEEVG